jgi:type II restriction enzyme
MNARPSERMEIHLRPERYANDYKSKSQLARVVTESWFEEEMFCPVCLNGHVSREKNNVRVVDFSCPSCKHTFQLKSQSRPLGNKVVDGAYAPLYSMIERNICPDFFFMEYSLDEEAVRNLLIIPRFFMNTSIVEKRKPLSPNARRAGWVGCNILLSSLPSEGKIDIIKNEREADPAQVKKQYQKLAFLDAEKHSARGWVSDVLHYVQKLNKRSFTLSEVYLFEKELAELHPENHHVKDKIRQQLQVLRDKGILRFDNKGVYSLR